MIATMAKLRLASCAAAALGLSLAPLQGHAHHSFAAEYDANQPVTLTGKVVQVELVNPHAWLYIEVAGDDGTTARWNVEMGAPNSLIRRGITKASVPVGTVVTVTGYRAKDGSNTVNSRTVTLGDGRALFSGSEGQGAPPAK
jgi:Family of unknown function (DUF6152)